MHSKIVMTLLISSVKNYEEKRNKNLRKFIIINFHHCKNSFCQRFFVFSFLRNRNSFQSFLMFRLHSFFFHFWLSSTNTEKSLQNKKRVIQMLFVVVLEFFICWTPLYVINTIALFNAQAVYQTLGYSTISYFQLLAYSSSCCNPITYCFMNRGFRKACLNLFRCCKKFHETRRISIGGGPVGVTQSSEVT